METRERILVQDDVKIGSWEEVTALPLSSITHNDKDNKHLDGIIIKGYETKFGVTNENGEQYDPHCLDAFIERYFVNHDLNMVVDVQHSSMVDDQVGRVIYLEVNSVGFYFVVYIPRRIKRYDEIKTLLEEGILQGFSKCGYADDYEWVEDKKKKCCYVLFKSFMLLSVSLVTAPANAQKFEKVAEVKNGITYVNKVESLRTDMDDDTFESLFI